MTRLPLLLLLLCLTVPPWGLLERVVAAPSRPQEPTTPAHLLGVRTSNRSRRSRDARPPPSSIRSTNASHDVLVHNLDSSADLYEVGHGLLKFPHSDDPNCEAVGCLDPDVGGNDKVGVCNVVRRDTIDGERPPQDLERCSVTGNSDMGLPSLSIWDDDNLFWPWLDNVLEAMADFGELTNVGSVSESPASGMVPQVAYSSSATITNRRDRRLTVWDFIPDITLKAMLQSRTGPIKSYRNHETLAIPVYVQKFLDQIHTYDQLIAAAEFVNPNNEPALRLGCNKYHLLWPRSVKLARMDSPRLGLLLDACITKLTVRPGDVPGTYLQIQCSKPRLRCLRDGFWGSIDRFLQDPNKRAQVCCYYKTCSLKNPCNMCIARKSISSSM